MTKRERSTNQDFSNELNELRQLIQRYPEVRADKPLSKDEIRELRYQQWLERRANLFNELKDTKLLSPIKAGESGEPDD
ncbi:hypothetical protein [Salicola sp. Rm-C-2C1-2]|uniref:hypothetical protein n=1 Tax=Salicola sp. Rm-C-2C1-2 TaxID=3141321 RepID=UPI0032E4E136